MERQDETPFTTKIDGKNWFGSQSVSYFVSLNFHSQLHVRCPTMPKLAVLARHRDTLQISLLSFEHKDRFIELKNATHRPQ